MDIMSKHYNLTGSQYAISFLEPISKEAIKLFNKMKSWECKVFIEGKLAIETDCLDFFIIKTISEFEKIELYECEKKLGWIQ